jgi:hypothetical protein
LFPFVSELPMSSITPCLDEKELINVLVVSRDLTRVTATRHTASGWPVPVDVEWTCNWHEAVRRARELPAQLVVVDCNGGVPDGVALAGHLKRHHSGLDVLAFADQAGDRRAALKVSVWPWSALDLVLNEWLDLHFKLRGADAAQALSKA